MLAGISQSLAAVGAEVDEDVAAVRHLQVRAWHWGRLRHPYRRLNPSPTDTRRCALGPPGRSPAPLAPVSRPRTPTRLFRDRCGDDWFFSTLQDALGGHLRRYQAAAAAAAPAPAPPLPVAALRQVGVVCVCMYVCMYVCVCMCVYVCLCVCVWLARLEVPRPLTPRRTNPRPAAGGAYNFVRPKP